MFRTYGITLWIVAAVALGDVAARAPPPLGPAISAPPGFVPPPAQPGFPPLTLPPVPPGWMGPATGAANSIFGVWQSDGGRVTLAGWDEQVTGSWDQGAGRQAHITG